jgi:hypothetical protein
LSTPLLHLEVETPCFVLEPGQCPCASPLARLQAIDESWATNLRHIAIPLSPLERHLLPYLDGEHDRAQLRAILARHLQGLDRAFLGAARDPAEWLEETLQQLARSAFLMA